MQRLYNWYYCLPTPLRLTITGLAGAFVGGAWEQVKLWLAESAKPGVHASLDWHQVFILAAISASGSVGFHSLPINQQCKTDASPKT